MLEGLNEYGSTGCFTWMPFCEVHDELQYPSISLIYRIPVAPTRGLSLVGGSGMGGWTGGQSQQGATPGAGPGVGATRGGTYAMRQQQNRGLVSVRWFCGLSIICGEN